MSEQSQFILLTIVDNYATTPEVYDSHEKAEAKMREEFKELLDLDDSDLEAATVPPWPGIPEDMSLQEYLDSDRPSGNGHGGFPGDISSSTTIPIWATMPPHVNTWADIIPGRSLN